MRDRETRTAASLCFLFPCNLHITVPSSATSQALEEGYRAGELEHRGRNRGLSQRSTKSRGEAGPQVLEHAGLLLLCSPPFPPGSQAKVMI